jgi:putative transposase
VKGRKRHLLVDTDGRLLQVLVHAANVQERAGAKILLGHLRFPAHRLRQMWCDAGYWGEEFPHWVQEHCGCRLEILSPNEVVNRRAGRKGYVAQPRRWVVERTFAWLGRYRRLSKDYEQNPKSSEAWILLASAALLLHRIS